MKPPKVITHSGHFQTDEVFAVAAIKLLYEGDIELVRTRDQDIIKTGNFVIDVGNTHDPAKNRFDHHQEGGAGARENGIAYSSLGLVWRQYGKKLCGGEEVARVIEGKLIEPIDANDNGIIFYSPTKEVHPYTIDDIIHSLNPTWKENDDELNKSFLEAVGIAERILKREIERAKDELEAKAVIEKAYENAKDKRIIILHGDYPSENILRKYEEPLYVIKPNRQDTNWIARAIKVEEHSFESRKPFPQEWGGRRDFELQRISGVPDAIFCHNKRFIVVARTQEGAIALAVKAANA